MRRSRLWYFTVPGYFYALGPIEATSKTAARKKAHEMGFPRVSAVWETSRREMEYIHQQRRRQIEEAANADGTSAIMLADI